MTPEQLAAMGEPPSSVAYLTARQAVNIDGWELWDCDFCGQKNVSRRNECGRCKRLRGEGKASAADTVDESWLRARDAVERLRGHGLVKFVPLPLPSYEPVDPLKLLKLPPWDCDFCGQKNIGWCGVEWLISQGWTPPPG